MKNLLALLLIVFSCQSVFAITPEQNYVNREAQRKEYADAMQRTHAMINRSTASSNGTTVTQTAKASATVSSGSKVTGSASVTKIANKAKVAATLAGRYGKSIAKASVGGFIGSAAFYGLMKGIDYVIDEGGKVNKPNSTYDPLISSSDEYVLEVKKYIGNNQYSTPFYAKMTYDESVKNSLCKKYISSNTRYSYPTQCLESTTYRGSVSEVLNPFKTPTDFPKSESVTPQELETALKNALESNNPALAAAIAQAIKDAYTHDGATAAIGDSTNELAASSDDDIGQAIDRAASNTGSESDAYGTAGYSKLVTPDKTIEAFVNPADTAAQTTTDSTTKNPDGTTSTTSASGSTQFPAFCDWASIVCDWYDGWKKTDEWLKEEPELKDKTLEVEEKEIISYQRQDYVQFGQSCPFTPKVQSLPMGVLGSIDFETDLTFICDFGVQARPYVLGLGHLAALIFLLIGLRNGNA